MKKALPCSPRRIRPSADDTLEHVIPTKGLQTEVNWLWTYHQVNTNKIMSSCKVFSALLPRMLYNVKVHTTRLQWIPHIFAAGISKKTSCSSPYSCLHAPEIVPPEGICQKCGRADEQALYQWKSLCLRHPRKTFVTHIRCILWGKTNHIYQ